MHLPPETPFLQNLTASQRFCVEFWHGQTHASSLDSYRVRFHNGRTILKELRHEIGLQLTTGAELQAISKEAAEICKEDTILLACLGSASARLDECLDAVIKDKALAEKSASIWLLGPVKKLGFLLEDVLPNVERDYLNRAVRLVRNEISAGSSPFFGLRTGISCLLTDLVDRGWTLESLHEWAGNLAGQVIKNKTFEERFTFLEKQITRGCQTFTACLRLTGSPEVADLGSFKGLHFSSSGPTLEKMSKEAESYLRQSEFTAFATCEVEAVDFKAACHSALEIFEGCLDRLRFNFLTTKLVLDSRMVLIRKGDQRVRLERVSCSVPNPVFSVEMVQFRKDSERIDELLANDGVARNSRERIESAARHYRLGQDSETYRDKLLNWWFGLEYLTKLDNAGPIGTSVARHGRDSMMARYTLLLLLDLEVSLRHTINSWPASVVTLLNCDPNLSIPPEKLLLVMQESSCRTDLDQALQKNPWLRVRFLELADTLADKAKSTKFISDHGQRVEWQLKRIYRARCCLVHGSPLAFRLMLLTANLEFYLRETVVLALRKMIRYKQINSLEVFYERLRLALDRRLEALARIPVTGAPPPEVFFDGMITSTKP